jgi:hypothetical protein
MVEEYVIVKMADLGRVDLKGQTHVVVKEGTQLPVFEVEGAQDAGDVAKGMLTALDIAADSDIVKGMLADDDFHKSGDSPLVEELLQKVEDLTAQVQALGDAPRPRRGGDAVLTRPGLEKRMDDGEPVDNKSARIYKDITGQEGASREDAFEVLKSWAEEGDVNTNVKKRNLRDAFLAVDIQKMG